MLGLNAVNSASSPGLVRAPTAASGIQGRSMKQAAAVLGLTPRTVAFHKYQMIGRLRLENNAELVQFAIRQGVIT